jgi:hypothetical protein
MLVGADQGASAFLKIGLLVLFSTKVLWYHFIEYIDNRKCYGG